MEQGQRHKLSMSVLSRLLAVAWLCASCGSGTPAPPAAPAPTRTSEPASDLVALSAAQRFASALETARAWKADAYLHSIEGIARWNDYPGRIFVSYFFYSVDAPNQGLDITYWSDGQMTTESITLTPDADRQAVSSDTWPVDNTEALQVGWANGGGEYLNRYRDSSTVHPQVTFGFRYRTERLTWHVAFAQYDELPDPAVVHVFVDACTGELLPVGN